MRQAAFIVLTVILVRMAIPADLRDTTHGAGDKEDAKAPTGLMEGLRLVCTRRCVAAQM